MSRRPSTTLSHGTLILEKAQRGICRVPHKEKIGGIWHKLLPEDHTNLGGQVLGEVPPSLPSLQEGCALTEGLSAVELPWEEQQVKLEMTDRKGYGLYWVAVPRENKDDSRL